MKKKNVAQLSPIFVVLSFIVPIVLQGLLLYYQISNDVLTFWNLFSSIFMVGIFINAVRMSINSKKEEVATTPEIQGESTVEITGPERKIKSTVIQAIIAVVTITLSIFFFNIYNNKTEGLQVINSEVVHQWGKIERETSVNGNEISETEWEYIEVTLRYNYNGVWHQEVVSANTTSEIFVDELKVYVDSNGQFVNTYGRIEIWKYEAIVLMVFGVIMALTAIFVLGAGFVAADIITGLGVGILLLVASPFIEDILYNDLSCFIGMFVNIGLYMLTYSVLTLIILGRKGLAGAITTTTTYVDKLPEPEEVFDEESTFNPNAAPYVPEMDKKPEEPAGNKFCQFCGSEIEAGSKFCDMCGARLTQDDE